MAPQKKVFKKSWDGNVVILATSEKDARRFDVALLSDDIRAKLTLHGLTQKLSDATAKEAGTSVEEKWEAIGEVWAALQAGEWSLKREGQGTMLLRALCEVYPNRTRDALKVWLDGRSTAEKTALSRNPRVKEVLDRLAAERASDIDTDALLDELE